MEMNDMSIVNNKDHYEYPYYCQVWNICQIIRDQPCAHAGHQFEVCPVASSRHVKGGNLQEKKGDIVIQLCCSVHT